jgi:outer membrane protein assembly factor BamA
LRLLGVSDAMQSKIAPVIEHAGGLYDSEKSAKSLASHFEFFYVGQGYAAVHVDAHRSGNPLVTEDAVRVPFIIDIQEGRTYKLGSIRVAPGSPIAQADVDKAGAANAQFPGENLYTEEVLLSIESRYKAKGYLDCTAIAHPEFDDTSGVVNYTVEANIGPVYHLALINFEDIGDDLRSLLMLNWQMVPGNPFNESYVGDFMLKAQKNNSALKQALAGLKATYDVRIDSGSHEVILVIRLEKQ